MTDWDSLRWICEKYNTKFEALFNRPFLGRRSEPSAIGVSAIVAYQAALSDRIDRRCD